MAQNQINTGNVTNDGTGAPLRTAFNETNLNFNQIWAAGPVNSNIQISNNTIQAVNTNGNIVLATNGIGVIVPATSIVPDIANVRMLGTARTPFNSVYAQYIGATSGTYTGNLYVAGNLLVDGAQVAINYSNLNIANSTITLSAGAPYPSLADGSGILVDGASASFTYSAINNDWVSNLPITAPYFVGDGGGLTNVAAITSAASMTGNTIASSVLYSNLQSVGTLSNLTVTGNIVGNILSVNTISANKITGVFSGDGTGLGNIPGGAVTGNVSNADYSTFAGTAATANLAALATQAVNADTALVALNASHANTSTTANYANLADVANTACMADIANSAVVAGMALNVGTLTTLTVTGNIVAGGIITDYYYYANGAPFIGGGGNGNYSNANVAAYLPIYSGDMLGLGNIASFGTASFNNVSITGNTVATTITTTTLSATGAVDSNAFYSDHYYYANGAPFTGSGYVLGDEQFYGTGTPGPYGLTQASTNNALIVTINGLVQTPGSSYTVSGNLITFTSDINTNELIDIRFLGVGAGAGNTTGNVDWLHVPTDIIPIGNNVQSLGNATNQWKHLWISNNTIYINSIPLTITAGNILTVNGANVVTTTGSGNVLSVNNLSVVGNVTGGNVVASYLYGNGSHITGITSTANTGNITFANSTISTNNTSDIIVVAQDTSAVIIASDNFATLQWTDVGNIANANGYNINSSYVYTDAGGAHVEIADSSGNVIQWNFNNDGSFDAPGNVNAGSINTSAINNPSGINILVNGVTGTETNGSQVRTYASNQPITIVDSSGLHVTGNVDATTFNGDGSHITNVNAVQVVNGTSNVTIPTTNGNVVTTVGGGQQWIYSTDGSTIFPNGAKLNNGTSHQFATDNTVTTSLDLRDTSGAGFYTNGSGFTLRSNGSENWIFSTNGNLTLPSNTASINYANGSPYGGSSGTSVAEAPFNIQSSNFTATAGARYGVNTTGGSVTATLPATPTSGQAVLFADAGGAFATNNLIIDPTTNSIMGGATGGTMTVSTNNVSVGLFYNGTTWRIYNAG